MTASSRDRADGARPAALRRGELARLAGCNAETVRHYEKVGLLPAPPRDAANWRVYDQGHVARLRFILRARVLGFALDEIAELLALSESGGRSCAEAARLASRRLEDVRARIADLRRMEAALADTLALCAEGEARGCPIIDALRGQD
ncbi:MerR family transcriptional regulator [Oceanicella actignis]|uniref:MerR family transcriptional regulator n=1 Tax=Oceanicella actignis TaxID=1189325 RepID=UPI0011E7457D|nr:helix-turn-helix domain-containing protein [Oceanicella actignis]TYO91177.1 MerR family mercuric resistance operon transcriptional regulator [Oceanicella actignis]